MIDIGHGREFWIRPNACIGIRHDGLKSVTVFLRGMPNYVAIFDTDQDAKNYIKATRDEVLS